MKFPLMAACVSVVIASIAPTAAAKKPEKGEAYLVRTVPASDVDARGTIRTTQTSNDEEIRFDATKLDPAAAFDVFMEDAAGSGVFVLFGAMDAGKHAGNFSLRVREKDGPLPLSAASVDDYADRAVEVRTGATVVLVGWVPPTEKKTGKQGFTKAKVELARPSSPPDADAKGRIELWEKIKDGRHRFRALGQKLSASETYKVFIEDAVGSGVFVEGGTLKKHDGKNENSSFKLFTDAKNGDPLPTGAKDVDALADRAVQIRDSGDVVVLEGILPSIS